MAWNTLTKTQSVILRSTNQQSATGAGLIYEPPTYTYPGMPSGQAPIRMEGLVIRRFELLNRAAAADVGIGFRIHNRYWRVGNYDGTTFTDDTADAQNTTANDFVIGANDTTGNTTFFTILSTVPFGWFSINVGTAEVNSGGVTVPDHSLRYTNAAGTGWTAYTAGYLNNFELTNTVIGTGAREFVWAPPSDWGRITGLTGLPNGLYGMQITSAELEAGDTAALGTAMEIGTMPEIASQVATNGIYAKDWITVGLAQADAVVAFFDVANADNRVEVEVTTG